MSKACKFLRSKFTQHHLGIRSTYFCLYFTNSKHTFLFKITLMTAQDSPQIALACVAKELLFDPVEMPPHQWRTTVRALLRVDIYGHEQGDFRHKGLRDLVNDMESRQRARHEIVDAATAAGITIGGHGLVGKDCNFAQPGATHTCLQILNIAKIAIDNLVIA